MGLILCLFPFTASADLTYKTAGKGKYIYEKISFLDSDKIQNLQAVQDYAALEVLFGDGGYFHPEATYSNANALRLIYRCAGRENEGLEAAFNLNLRKKYGLGEYTDSAWADGFYMLALQEGLIKNKDFVNAFIDENSKLAKNNDVTVQNFIKWLGIILNVPESDIKVPEETVSATRDDLAYILSLFEEYILKARKVTYYEGEVTKINERAQSGVMSRSVYVSTDSGNIILQTLINENEPVFSSLAGEIPVLGKGGCDTLGSVRVGEKIRAYIHESKVLFARVTEPVNSFEYIDQPMVYRGTVFLYDHVTNSLVLDNVVKSEKQDKSIYGYLNFYLEDEPDVYYNGEKVDIKRLNDDLIDKNCIVFLSYEYRGGLNKVYSIVIN